MFRRRELRPIEDVEELRIEVQFIAITERYRFPPAVDVQLKLLRMSASELFFNSGAVLFFRENRALFPG
jgi:hypothetical protein